MWQETLSAHLEGIGFVRGRGHPCVFYQPQKNIKTLVHGDDYVSAGSTESMARLEAELSKAYEIKTQKIRGSHGDVKDGKVLNQILRFTNEGWEIEADQRHAELVVEQLNLCQESGLNAPGAAGAKEDD